jgi:uncharacterized protein YjbI with pentapeptide repeats
MNRLTPYTQSMWRTILVGLIALTIPIVASAPNRMAMDAFIVTTDTATGNPAPLRGTLAIMFELITPDETSVFKTSQVVIATNGLVHMTIDDATLPVHLFETTALNIRLTVSEVTDDSRTTLTNPPVENGETLIIPLHRASYVLYSNAATTTDAFNTIISLNHDTNTIGINTDPMDAYRLTIKGTAKATAWIGDGSKLTNLGYTKWEKHPKHTSYTRGRVGIGTNTPTHPLTVSGNTVISQPIIIDSPPLAVVQDTLWATIRGDAQDISSFNATNVSTGTVSADRLFGKYPTLTGTGTITTGTWNGHMIMDDYIGNDLELTSSTLLSPNLSGTLNRRVAIKITSHSNTFPIEWHSKNWSLSDTSVMSAVSVGDVSLTETELTGTEPKSLSITGDTIPSITLDALGGIVAGSSDTAIIIGNTQNDAPGTLRLSAFFEGKTSEGWKRLDLAGNATGYSLFPKDNLSNPVIHAKPNGHLGIHTQNPLEAFMVSGNVVMHGNVSDDIVYSNDEPSMMWVASKGAFRLGEFNTPNPVDPSNPVGKYSVGIGPNSHASGERAINLINKSTTRLTNVTGTGAIAIAVDTQDTTLPDPHSIAISSGGAMIIGEESIAFSMYISNESPDTIQTGTANTVLNGSMTDPPSHSHTIVGGMMAPKTFGNNSFLWNAPTIEGASTEHNNAFIISGSVGINTEDTKYNSLTIGGALAGETFQGNGYYLTGEVYVTYLKFYINQSEAPIDGPEKKTDATGTYIELYPAFEKKPYHIYVSDTNGYLPTDTVSGESIADGTIKGANIDGYSLDTTKFMDKSIIESAFDNGSVDAEKFNSDILSSEKFADITGDDIAYGVITDNDLVDNSIETRHIANEAIVFDDIPENSVNSTNMTINNIADHSIQGEDIKPEPLNSSFFADAAAIGFGMAIGALKTTTNDDGIDDSHIMWKDADGNSAPSIQARHIADNAITSSAINPDSVDDRVLAKPALTADDWNPSPPIANDTTLQEGPIWIGRHFADGTFTNAKWQDDCDGCSFLLTPAQLGNAIIESRHIADSAIQIRDIAEKTIVGRHIKDKSIQTSTFSDASIHGRHLADNSISSEMIVYKTIARIDIGEKTIDGTKFSNTSITNEKLMLNSITSQNIMDGAIQSVHIAYKSLTNDDFAPGAFTAAKIKGSTIISEQIANGTLQDEDFGEITLTTEKFINEGLNWADFEMPPEPPNEDDLLAGYFPGNRFGDGTLSIEDKFKENIEFDGSKLVDKSITSQQLNIPSFDPSKIEAPLAVSHGGTGLTDFAPNGVIFVTNDPETANLKMAQSEYITFTNTGNTPTLKLGNPTAESPVQGMIVSGNILVENGALILTQNVTVDPPTYTFITYNSDINGLQLTHNQPLTSTISNMDIKTKQLSVATSLVIGDTTPLNGLDVASGFILGSTYRDKAIPPNGLLVEGTLQIGSSVSQDPSATLTVTEEIRATSKNAIVVTTNTANSAPIQTDGRTLSASGQIGIDTGGKTPISVTVESQYNAPVGIDIAINYNPDIDQSGISSNMTLDGHSFTTHFLRSTTEFNAGIYGKAPTLSNFKNYAGYFNGPVAIKQLKTTASESTETATESPAMVVDNVFFDGSVGMGAIPILQTIDWSNGNMRILTVDDNSRDITFKNPPEGFASKMIILIKHTGTGKVSFPETIQWANEYTPELSNVADAIDIVVLSYIDGRYFGEAGYNFH